MLEKREERIKLLKSGLTGKAIEELYIKYNNFKILNNQLLYVDVEFDFLKKKDTCSLNDKIVNRTRSLFIAKQKELKSGFFIFGLFFILFIPIQTMFLTSILGLVLIPPMIALAVIFIEGIPLFLETLNELSMSYKEPFSILSKSRILKDVDIVS